jgi:uncharacterized protein with beta-barrel porin domain
MVRVGWSHEYADLKRQVTAAFAGAPAFDFTTQGASAPRDGVTLAGYRRSSLTITSGSSARPRR